MLNQINNFNNYRYLLFDLDNTLLDFTKSSRLAFADLMAFFKIKSDENLYEIYSSINAKYWHYFERQKISAQELNNGRFKEFLRELNSDLNENDLAEKYLELLVKHSFWISGAENLLKKYAATHHISLITNGLKKAQHSRLEKHNMKEYFNMLFISEELGISKPNALFFEKVYEALNKPNKNEVLVIGDNPESDIKGGKKFGFRTCWYNYKQNKKQTNKANYVINDWNIFLKTECA